VRPHCSRELESPDAQPYFVWDEPTTVADLRRHLASGDEDERLLWSARILRDARFDDVWRFLSVKDVVAMWPRLAPRLGRRRAFWT
jgi:hypothetical protein